MIKSEICRGRKETVDFLNSLEEKGYNTIMTVISITQNNDYHTVFYKYLEDLENNNYNL